MPLLPTGDLGNLTGNTWGYRAVSGQPDLSNDVRMPVDVLSRTVPRLVSSFSLQTLPYTPTPCIRFRYVHKYGTSDVSLLSA